MRGVAIRGDAAFLIAVARFFASGATNGDTFGAGAIVLGCERFCRDAACGMLVFSDLSVGVLSRLLFVCSRVS